MSSASTSRTIKFITKAGTYTAVIMSPEGDLYQDYEGTPGATTTIFPDFSTLNPRLFFVCTSSRVAEGIATPRSIQSIQFFCNNAEITFSGAATTPSSNFSGAFKKIYPDDNNPYYGLQIVRNLADITGYAPITIKMLATLSYGTQTDSIEASYVIPVQKATGSSYHITIAAGDDKNFIISDKDDSCILKAKVWQGGSEITNGLTYEWQKLTPTGWQAIETETAQQLTVNITMVDTYGEFRVVVSKDGSEIGSDVQSVMDVSDPYDIDPHPMPADETIEEGNSARDHVTYTPVVVKRGSTDRAFETLFFFVIKDAAGVFLNVEEMGTPNPDCTVDVGQCRQAGGDVSVTITSEQ